MSDVPDRPSPVRLFFSGLRQRISEGYSWIETVAKRIHGPISTSVFSTILAVFLAMFGTIVIYPGAVLAWVFTFSWLSTVDSIQKRPVFKRFLLAAALPMIVWTVIGYLALKVTPNLADEVADKVAKLVSRTEPKPETEAKSPGANDQWQEKAKPQQQAKPEAKTIVPPVKTALSIELAPRVLHYVDRYNSHGEIVRHSEYGFGAIVRTQNKGQTTQQIKSLEITGDIDAGSFYHLAYGEGKTSEEIDSEYGKRKPYLRLSFVAYPIDSKKIEGGGEEFIRFMILNPTKLGTQGFTYGAEARNYIGFRGENPAEPKFLITVPSISFFAKPTGFRPVRPGNDQWTGVVVRDEIKSGSLKFTVQFNSGPQVVTPSKISNVRLMGFDDWNKQIPQEIFFDIDRRFIPVEKDPRVERR
jgi:hypothetical protein